MIDSFTAYYEQNSMPSDEVGSAAFYANWRKIRTQHEQTTDTAQGLLVR